MRIHSASLNDRAPTIKFNLKESAETDHEPGYRTDNMLGNRHVDHHNHPTAAII
jgi:hypothetical protein